MAGIILVQCVRTPREKLCDSPGGAVTCGPRVDPCDVKRQREQGRNPKGSGAKGTDKIYPNYMNSMRWRGKNVVIV